MTECKSCKTKVSDATKFCPECGKPIPKPEPKLEQNVKPMPTIMTVQQVAEFLKVSKPTVYLLIREHNLPWFPIGQCKRFITDEIIQWAKTRQAAV